jgi:aldehyde dehydrogenase (NAD+)
LKTFFFNFFWVFDTEEEAIRMANDTVYGLGAYIQTTDLEKAQRVAKRIRAGNISINGAAYDYDVPFGGMKQSGNGRENGLYGLHDFLDIKAITI